MRKLYLFVRSYLTVFLVCGTIAAFAQVTGQVISSDDNSPIPGVNVLEKGTANGTVTDADGKFTINVTSNATLVFSFVGYASQEVAVGSQTSINVSLVSDVTALAEVVVVGYGSQDKKEITGSVVSLDTKDFNRGNVNDPSQLLQGKVAGLSIYNKGGDPNSSPIIRLRGISTIGSNQQPLIVIDGVLGASLDNVDPNDIETVNVLKDGSAAAIYGSRGSSGVILVTTKRGSKKAGGPSITFNTYVASASVYKRIPVMSAGQYVAAGGNDLLGNTDWQDQVTQTGVSNVNNIAISGGTENTSYRVSANFRNVSGVLKKSGFDQINTRASLTHTAMDGKLKIDLNMALTNRNQDFSFPEALRYAALYNPTAPIYFPNGDYYQAILFDNFNPVAIINQNSNTGKNRVANFGGKIDYQIFKGLTWTINYGQQFTSNLHDEYYSSRSLFRGLNRNGLARKFSSDAEFKLFETYGTYSKNMDKVNLDVSAGYSYQQDKYQDFFVELGDFPSDLLMGNQLESSGDRLSGIPATTNIASSKSPVNKIIAFFGRVNLTFDNAIFFNASVREEGSSKLGIDHRWGMFPAVGAGVDLNKYLQLPSVSLLKFRVGYGVTGSLPSDAGLAQDNYNYSFDQGGSVSIKVDGNKDLKWEQKAETNIGLEFGLLKGRVTGALDVYSRDIKDFILLRSVPAVDHPSGWQYQNAGSLNTKGIELTIAYNNIHLGQVSWTPSLVVSHYTSVLKSYIIDKAGRADFGSPGQNGTNIMQVKVGEKIGQIWGPVFDGVNESNGAVVFKDLNGDGTIDATAANAQTSADFKTLGWGIPTAEIGWNNTLTFKNWDVSVFIRGAFGHSLVNQFRGFYEPIDLGAINSYNRVTTKKAVAGLQEAKYSSLYVEKADFIRLDNMQIGYNFKLNSRAFKSIRLYVAGQNLFVISNYTGIDPDPVLVDRGSSDNGGFPNEKGTFTATNNIADAPDVLSPGIDRRNNYFTARTFTFGLNVGF